MSIKAGAIQRISARLFGNFLSWQRVFDAFGHALSWGAEVGLSVADVTIFVSFIYIGGLLFQYPIGWLSDRKARRKIVFWLSIIYDIPLIKNIF